MKFVALLAVVLLLLSGCVETGILVDMSKESKSLQKDSEEIEKSADILSDLAGLDDTTNSGNGSG